MYNEEVMQQILNHFSELVMLFWFIKVHYFLHRSIWMSYVVSVKPRIRGDTLNEYKEDSSVSQPSWKYWDLVTCVEIS